MHIPFYTQPVPHLTTAKMIEVYRAMIEDYHLMQVLARACGHSHLNQFCPDDLTTYNRDMAYLTGIAYGGVVSL